MILTREGYSAAAFVFLLVSETLSFVSAQIYCVLRAAHATCPPILGGSWHILCFFLISLIHDLPHVHIFRRHGKHFFYLESCHRASLKVLLDIVCVAELFRSLLCYLSLVDQISLTANQIDQDLSTGVLPYI